MTDLAPDEADLAPFARQLDDLGRAFRPQRLALRADNLAARCQPLIQIRIDEIRLLGGRVEAASSLASQKGQ